MGVLIPNLKHSLLDPAPEVRSAAAQAIGSIVRHNTTGVFSSYTTDLIPWLKERMMSKSSMVDRLGAAQGLAEVSRFGIISLNFEFQVVAAFEAGTDIIMAQAIEFASDPTNDPVSLYSDTAFLTVLFRQCVTVTFVFSPTYRLQWANVL